MRRELLFGPAQLLTVTGFLHLGIMRTGLGHAIDIANVLDVFTTTALFKDSKGPE